MKASRKRWVFKAVLNAPMESALFTLYCSTIERSVHTVIIWPSMVNGVVTSFIIYYGKRCLWIDDLSALILHGSYTERKSWTRKITNSTALRYLHFGMNSQGFVAVRLTWPAYDDGRKRENSSAWRDRIIVASTCRRSVAFGCYVIGLWMAKCVTIRDDNNAAFVYLHHPLPWQTSMENVTPGAHTSRKPFLIGWIHSLDGDHVSLRLHS